MHSIYVCAVGSTGHETMDLLAVDIVNESAARRLVRGIATSFSAHGLHADGRRYWFQTERGRHEIWCEPDTVPHEAPARRPVRTRRSSFAKRARPAHRHEADDRPDGAAVARAGRPRAA